MWDQLLLIDNTLVDKAIKGMKTGRGESTWPIKNHSWNALKTAGGVGYGLIKHVVNQVVHEGVPPNDWYSSIM